MHEFRQFIDISLILSKQNWIIYDFTTKNNIKTRNTKFVIRFAWKSVLNSDAKIDHNVGIQQYLIELPLNLYLSKNDLYGERKSFIIYKNILNQFPNNFIVITLEEITKNNIYKLPSVNYLIYLTVCMVTLN